MSNSITADKACAEHIAKAIDRLTTAVEANTRAVERAAQANLYVVEYKRIDDYFKDDRTVIEKQAMAWDNVSTAWSATVQDDAGDGR